MENIEERLFDYLENRLSKEDKDKLEEEMSGDAWLERQVHGLRDVDKLMKEYNMLELDDAKFTDSIMIRIDNRKSTMKTSNRLLWMALGIFAGIFAGVAALIPLFQTTQAAPVPKGKYLPSLPAFNFTSLMNMVDNPALVQLVVVINAIAILLVADRVLSKKFKINLPAIF